jgi:putative ABC transport system ATP-binding protein
LRLERVAYIFQGYNLVPVLSAEENAEFILLLRGVPSAERRARVRALLCEVGLGGLERRRPAQLSGGQQQRVAVVRAIAAKPALVLADEPTANLDTTTASALLDLMETLHHELRTTFLFSTHDPRIMERAHRLIQMRDGRIDRDEPLATPGARPR